MGRGAVKSSRPLTEQRADHLQLSLRAAIRTGIDLGLFYKLSEQPQSAAKLAQATGADVELLGVLIFAGSYEWGWLTEGRTARILKHLAAMHVVREASSDTYSATPLSIALTEQIYVDSLKFGQVFASALLYRIT